MSVSATRRPAWLLTAWNITWRVAIALGLITFIALHLNLARVGLVLRHIAPGFAVAAALVMLLVGVITAAKWLVLLRALGVHATLGEVVRLTYIAVAWNLALPGGESGNLVKAALLARQRRDAAGAVWASMLVDQMSLAVAQILVGITTLLLASFPPAHLGLWLGTSASILAGILLVYALFLLPWRTAQVDAAIGALSRRLAVRRKTAPPPGPLPISNGEGEIVREVISVEQRDQVRMSDLPAPSADAADRNVRPTPLYGHDESHPILPSPSADGEGLGVQAAPQDVGARYIAPDPVNGAAASVAPSDTGPQGPRREWLAPLWQGLTRYRGHVGVLVAAVAIAALYYATIFLAYWLAAHGLGIAFGYADIAWILALAGIAALLPITVAGVGVRDGIIVYFLHERGVVLETALAFSFAVLALQIVLGLPGIIAHFIHTAPEQTRTA